MPAKKKAAGSQSGQKRQEVYLTELDWGWIASGPSVLHSGMLYFYRSSDTYEAVVREGKILFPKLAKGVFAPGESPFDDNRQLKTEFLFLMALREQSVNNSPGRPFAPFR